MEKERNDVVEGAPMKQEEFEQKIKEVSQHNRKQMIENFNRGTLYLINFMGVSKYKSIRRAIKRGHVSMFGDLYPKRPYNNRGTKESKIRRMIYGQIKQTT